MVKYYAATIFALTVAVIVIIAFYVFANRQTYEDGKSVSKRIYGYRYKYFIFICVVLAIAFIFTLPKAPYLKSIPEKPVAEVNVTGMMWAWILQPVRGSLSPDELVLPARRVVEFNVTSRDVNHGFGIYTDKGELIGQVQAMPGYTNHLYMTFDKPGTYHVLCLEFCGVGHHAMMTTFKVR